MRVSVLPPEAGALSLRQPGSVIFPSYTPEPESAPVLSLHSELNRANIILEGLRFSPSADFFGAVVLAFEVNDGGASGRGGALSANSSMSLEVTPINDPPDIIVPREHRRSGGRGPLPILGVEISDVDSTDGETVTVDIFAARGTISVDPSPEIRISKITGEEGTEGAGLSVAGLLPDVMKCLSHVWFVLPSPGWEGGSTITFSATDGKGGTGSTECVVVVVDPDVAPIIAVANDTDTFFADQGVKTPLPVISVADFVEDAAVLGGTSSPMFEVVVAAEAGGVGLFPVPPGLSAVPESETAEKAAAAIIAGEGLQGAFGTPRSTLSFLGTLPVVNAALEAVSYVSADGSKGLGNNSVTVEVTRQGRFDAHAARHELVVDVQPVNQPPVILWNSTLLDLELPEVGGFSLRGLSFVDTDIADGGTLSVQLEVLADGDNLAVRSNGVGIEFSQGSADGVPSPIIKFRGNATSVADAISESAIILDAPGMPRALVPALRVTVADDDGGETSQVVEVLGSHVNSPPEIAVDNPQPMTLKEGGVLQRVGELAGISVHDADVEDSSLGFLEVNVSASHHAVLEVQNVTTSATIIHPVQTVTTRSSSGTVGGVFGLKANFTGLCDTCGVEETASIWHDAVANEEDVRVGTGSGSETGESMQAKLEALTALQVLGISVHCQRQNDLSVEGGREWRVTFLDAPASFPLMEATGELTGDAPSVEVAYAIEGNAISGSFTLSLGGYQTELIPYDAEATDVAAALEALPSVTAVDVTTPDQLRAQAGRQWSVTFFNALGVGGDVSLMEVDAQALDGRGASVQVVEVVRGDGIAELWDVRTSAAHENLVTVVSLTGALQAKGYFQLGLDYGGQQAWTKPIYPDAVGPANDEDGGSWSFGGGVPGHRRGESIESRILSLENWGELGPTAGVTVNRVDSADGDIVQWGITFVGAPAGLEAPSVESTYLAGGAAVSFAVASTHNQVQGYFVLAYGNASTSPLAHDSSGAEIAAALNALDSLHSPDVGTGVVAATRMQETTLEGGRRWSIAVLRDPEYPANLTAMGTLTTGLSGASARASTALVRRGGRGAILRLVDLGGAAFGIPGYTTGERLTLRGAPETITNALASLSYSPRARWNGGVDIILRAYDGGFSGSGGPQSGRGVVSAIVEAVNNPPELLWCGAVLGWGGARVDGVDEDAPFSLVDYDCEGGGTPVTPTLFDHIDLGGPGQGLTVHDPDGEASMVEVRKQVVRPTACSAMEMCW